MHDCVKWVFTGQRALKQAQELQTVLELAQPKRQDSHDVPSCPLSKFINTEESQGGVIALIPNAGYRMTAHNKVLVGACLKNRCQPLPSPPFPSRACCAQ